MAQRVFPGGHERIHRADACEPDIHSALIEAGFQIADTELCSIRPDLQDFFWYSGKFRPEMYLSDQVRQGISTFAALADPDEVAEGCRRLAEGIASGDILEVQRRYDNSGGDYIFLRATKLG